MRLIFKISFMLISFLMVAYSSTISGEKVFQQYCWGCHHETSVAFGPSFEQIANKRSLGEIQGHILSPTSTYEQLGYKRSVMPSFKETLSQEELDAVAHFILSFKSVKK